MKKSKVLSVIMAVLMVMTLLPSLVFAAEVPSGAMDGKLKMKGAAAVGVTLSADYSKAKPEGLTDDYVTFQWSRKDGETLTEIGTEKTYKVTEADLGYQIVLQVTGIEDKGVTGSLKATSNAVAATEQEAQELAAASGETEGTEPAPEEIPDKDEVLILGENETEDPMQPAEEIQEEIPEAQSGEVYDIQPEETSEEIPDPQEDASLPEEDSTGEEDYQIPEEAVINEEYPGQEDAGEDVYQIPEATNDGTWYEEGAEEASQEDVQQGDVPVYEEDALVYTAEAETESADGVLDFGTLEEGFEESQAGYATITNTGTGVLDFISMSPEHFMVQDIEEPLQPGDSVNVWIQPRVGTEPGVYNDLITYETLEGASASFQANVTVAEKQESEPAEDASDEEDMVPVDGAGILQGSTDDNGNSDDTQNTDDSDPDNQNPDDTEPTDPEPVPAVITPSETAVNLGELTAGYTPVGTTVTLKNEGTEKVTLQPLADCQYFDVSLSATELEAGGEAVLTILPKALEAREEAYSETINIFAEGNETVLTSVTAEFKVAAPTENPDTPTAEPTATETPTPEPTQTPEPTATPVPVYNLAVNPAGLEFGVKEAGYTASPQAQTVTITNTGNMAVNLTQPVSASFDIGALSAAVLEPNMTSSFTITPKAGLAQGEYSETITIPNKEGINAFVSVHFSVTKTTVKLVSIQKVSDIKGIANGSEKSVQGLKLPSTVVINTTNGELKANVKWDVKGSSYNAGSTEEQTFTVNGTVTLPEGIENPEGISLITSVKVNVKAYAPKVPEVSENQITGISSEAGYTTETKITFTAIGAGMDNTNPRKGDIRYVPLNWKVLETRTWENAPYTATFRMGQGGNYTLTVTFSQEKFDGSNWVKTGEQVNKQVNFTVAKANSTTSLTPTPTGTGNRKSAVKTGDNTTILPFIIILVVAVICIAGVVVYRKKRK